MDSSARQITEAIYQNGVLRPLGPLHLEEQEKVRVIVEKAEWKTASDRTTLLARLREGIERMNFLSNGRYPSRDELHDRY